jgi:hypothetical protein
MVVVRTLSLGANSLFRLRRSAMDHQVVVTG